MARRIRVRVRVRGCAHMFSFFFCFKINFNSSSSFSSLFYNLPVVFINLWWLNEKKTFPNLGI